jgi:hypothetical protein
MNIKEILADYFQLTPIEKDELLAELSEYYFQEGINLGLTTSEIIKCFQPLIDDAVQNDDFEVAQAFKDIKDAIEIVIKKRMEENGLQL